MRVLLPWDKLFLYDLRLQTHDDTYNAISKDGVNLDRDDQHPVPAEARCGPAAASDHRAGLHQADAEPRDRQPRARDHRRILRRRSLFDQAPGDSEEDPHPHRGHARPEHDAADRGGERIRRALPGLARRDAQSLRHAGARPGAAADRDRARSTARSSNIIWSRSTASASSARRRNRSASRSRRTASATSSRPSPGNFRFLRALARHRGDAAARAVAQHQDRDHRQRQGRPAGHPRQRRYADAAEPGRPAASPGAAPLPDNSEAAKQRPASASPPLLEKTPASNLQGPPERPSPTAVPRAPIGRRRTAGRHAAEQRARRAPGQASTGAAGRAAHVLDLVRDPGSDFANGRAREERQPAGRTTTRRRRGQRHVRRPGRTAAAGGRAASTATRPSAVRAAARSRDSSRNGLGTRFAQTSADLHTWKASR